MRLNFVDNNKQNKHHHFVLNKIVVQKLNKVCDTAEKERFKD